jgi:hypothetical protein
MKLTDMKCRQSRAAAAPYKLADRHGLYLLVQVNGARLWRMDCRFDGEGALPIRRGDFAREHAVEPRGTDRVHLLLQRLLRGDVGYQRETPGHALVVHDRPPKMIVADDTYTVKRATPDSFGASLARPSISK